MFVKSGGLNFGSNDLLELNDIQNGIFISNLETDVSDSEYINDFD